MFIKQLIQMIGSMFTHQDKSAKIDAWRMYGRNAENAYRDTKTMYDVEAPNVNANVNIAIRAISDAIKSLPIKIVGMEIKAGVEREYEDSEHEANAILRNPNPEHTFSQIVEHNVKSYLSDGNAFVTMERYTGPNTRVELWPRDPRTMTITLSGGRPAGYKCGREFGSQDVIFYRRSNVIHIRDIDPTNPFYGKSRIESIRNEIMMDYFINEFNKKFFQNGAALNLMFTPDHNLTDEQHEQLLDALTADLGGVDNAFKIFVNKFAGKIESPDQKHKDIAFLDLAKYNREKIFGVYGLPPFRGGIMEYANYANALAQDLDFWNNTIKPIVMVLEDAYNKQFIWPLYGTDYRLKFDMSQVPAIKGDPKQQAEIYQIYSNIGAMDVNEIRERLDMAPKKENSENKTVDDNPTPSDDANDKEEDPNMEEVDDTTNALWHIMRSQREEVLKNVANYCVDGRMMSRFMDSKAESEQFFDVIAWNKKLSDTLSLSFRETAQTIGTTALFAKHSEKKFDIDDKYMQLVFQTMQERLFDFNRRNLQELQMLLKDVDNYNMSYKQLVSRIRRIFNVDKAKQISCTLVKELHALTGEAVGYQLISER